MFAQENYRFEWKDIGDIVEGRPNLGQNTSVAAYRLMQFTLRNILIDELNVEETNEIFVKAGELAGSAFCRNLLDSSLDFNAFVADLQAKLKSLNMGILRIEEADLEQMTFTMTVSEDLDCSGLPTCGETVCHYDEGFIAGILETYTGKRFQAKEVDCWTSDGRVCRFVARALD